jgi:hypothetical protein
MSTVKIKQLLGPTDSNATGASIVFDNGIPRWSNTIATGLLLPDGSTEQRPGAASNGLLRYNSTTNKIEAYEDSSWKNVLTGTLAFKSLEDVPASYTGGANKVVKVKEDESGLEFVPFPSGVMRYRFKVNFTGILPTSVEVMGETAGWTVNIVETDDLEITHNLGDLPCVAVAYGRDVNITTKYYQKIAGTGSTGVFTLGYDTADMNKCFLDNVTAVNTNSAADTHCYIDLYFLIMGI